MKIRNGFISNSSSSSFLVDANWFYGTKYMKEDGSVDYKKLKKYVIKLLKKYAETHSLTEYWNNIYNDEEELEEAIFVGDSRDLADKLGEWYAPIVLTRMNQVVIYGYIDNIIPEEVYNKLKKKFGLVEYLNCHPHMG